MVLGFCGLSPCMVAGPKAEKQGGREICSPRAARKQRKREGAGRGHILPGHRAETHPLPPNSASVTASRNAWIH